MTGCDQEGNVLTKNVVGCAINELWCSHKSGVAAAQRSTV